MNSRKALSRYLIFLIGFMLAGNIFLSNHYNIPYPAPLGPQFEAGIKDEHMRRITETQPDLVLIGDSVLYEGVDPILLSEQLGKKTYAITVPGSGTASWYLLMKNVIFESPYRPKYITILFRNTMLTVPQYRTTGKYFPLLDDFATKKEPLVTELAFVNQMSPLERFMQRYIPVYSARLEIRTDMDNMLRYKPTSMVLNCDRTCTDNAVGSIFGREVDPIALSQMLEDAAKTLYDPKEMDFEKQLGTSLLPYIIELAKKNDVSLVFVRTKVFGPNPAALNEYSEALDRYLSGHHGVFLLDFSHDTRITQIHYVDSLHPNQFGKREFTKMLADEFKNIIFK